MYIWFLDCGNATVTKVHLSQEKEDELNEMLDNETGDVEDFISKYEDDFGISLNSSSWMISESDKVYEVEC